MFSPKRYRSHLASLIHSGKAMLVTCFVEVLALPLMLFSSLQIFGFLRPLIITHKKSDLLRLKDDHETPPGNRFTWRVLFFQFNCIFVAWLDSWAIIILMPTWSSGSRFFNVRLADQCVRVIDQRLFITAPESFKLLFACRCGFAAHPEHGSKT